MFRSNFKLTQVDKRVDCIKLDVFGAYIESICFVLGSSSLLYEGCPLGRMDIGSKRSDYNI